MGCFVQTSAHSHPGDLCLKPLHVHALFLHVALLLVMAGADAISIGSRSKQWMLQREVQRMSADIHRPGRKPAPATSANIRFAFIAWPTAVQCRHQSSTTSSTTSSRLQWTAAMRRQSLRRRVCFGTARTIGSLCANHTMTSRRGQRMERSGDMSDRKNNVVKQQQNPAMGCKKATSRGWVESSSRKRERPAMQHQIYGNRKLPLGGFGH